jgi:hypothetical protein
VKIGLCKVGLKVMYHPKKLYLRLQKFKLYFNLKFLKSECFVLSIKNGKISSEPKFQFSYKVGQNGARNRPERVNACWTLFLNKSRAGIAAASP